jgi:hypothetical protein
MDDATINRRFVTTTTYLIGRVVMWVAIFWLAHRIRELDTRLDAIESATESVSAGAQP